jgi:hypothetical protein
MCFRCESLTSDPLDLKPLVDTLVVQHLVLGQDVPVQYIKTQSVISLLLFEKLYVLLHIRSAKTFSVSRRLPTVFGISSEYIR